MHGVCVGHDSFEGAQDSSTNWPYVAETGILNRISAMHAPPYGASSGLNLYSNVPCHI